MKKIKQIIKKVPGVILIKNIFLFFVNYKYDYIYFLKNYSHSQETKNKIGYNILLITHSLEKGMSNKNLRPFGVKKIMQLKQLLNKYTKYKNFDKDFVFINGINCMRNYVKIYKDNNWINYEEYLSTSDFLNKYNDTEEMNVGSFPLKKEDFINDSNIDFLKFLSSRHSVRNYQKAKIKKDDIEYAINCAIKTPTACNRQMVKVYYISNKEKASELIKLGQGFSGFEKDTINLFVVTFDVNANYFIGERNQGWFNAGLFSMNLVNAFHSIGIGSCFIQFGNPFKEEEKIKKIINIPNNERIAVFLAAGYYADESLIPYSERKKINDIYKEI